MIFGHQRNLKILSYLIEKKKFPHAFLFSGPEKIGKRKIAIEITKYLESHFNFAERNWRPQFNNFFDFSQGECDCPTCKIIERGNFPDLTVIGSDGNEIPIKKIRELRLKLSLRSPFPFKIVIIDNAERLTREAESALLKILEEPSEKTIFFLLTSLPKILSKTILSRVEILKFNILSREEIKKIVSGPFLVDLSLGKPGLAKEFSQDKGKAVYFEALLKEIQNLKKLSSFEKFLLAESLEEENKTLDFLSLLQFWLRDLILAKCQQNDFKFSSQKEEIKKESKNISLAKIIEILAETQKTKNYINFSNVSRQLCLENLLLKI